MGRAPSWRLMLGQERPEQVSRFLSYHEAILQSRHQQFQRHQDSVAHLQEIEQESQAVMQSLQKKKQQLQDQYHLLVKKRQEREQTLSKLRKSLQNKDQQLKQQKEQQKELARIIAAASRIVSGKGFSSSHVPFKQRKGKLPWPVAGSIQHRFGSVRSGGGRWDGVLLRTAAGSPVRAIHGGRVLFADWLPGQGMLMIVDHGDQYMSLYGHNEALLKRPGEWVAGGDTIARSGDSGGQQFPGLYFEIRHKGVPGDPAAWCK